MTAESKKTKARQDLMAMLYAFISEHRPTLKEVRSLIRWIRLTHANI